VSSKRRQRRSESSAMTGNRAGSNPARAATRPTGAPPTDRRARIGLLIVVIVLAAVVVIGADFIISAVTGSTGSSAASTPTANSAQVGVVVQGRGGHWTNVSADQLAQMLQNKDFTLVNVKTPYIGEIAGTDLYLPYDQLSSRASALPTDKNSRVFVYCRSGVQSAQAAQTLLDLGYANVWNLDGGMNAWQTSGRTLVNLNRQ
jgi:rhodanese-related sulfurtransferase